MAKIGIDLDGVIYNFNSAYHDKLIKITGENRFPTDWYAPVWDWDKFYGYTNDEITATLTAIQKDKLFWQKLKLLVEPEVMSRLNVLSKENDLYFLTNRFGIKCKQQTEKALYDAGINYPTVMIVRDKLPVIKALNLDFFVDDKLETMNPMVEHQIASKAYIKLIDAPYNREGRRANLQVVSDLKTALIESELW